MSPLILPEFPQQPPCCQLFWCGSDSNPCPGPRDIRLGNTGLQWGRSPQASPP
ncbi:hypothetical protein [Prochlorothrix hollandica]|uniref:hypothetical protein n=1 Tax=Prochlorothrix hollandica TaxID=1223 RepID=UPI000346EE2F|nr:hypothetical protein [Prochlorothrix hollandica]